MISKDFTITKTRAFVEEELRNENSGHDWWHIYRVTELAKIIGKKEGADLYIVELAALLHDLADEKLYPSEEYGLKRINAWLTDLKLLDSQINHILDIVTSISYKGGNNPPVRTIEAMVVQDADRIDALGAIGIARTFAFAGAFGELMYDPNIPPRDKMSQNEYRHGKSTAINHFYEKLLLLKDLMNTESGKQEAKLRHQFMEMFLQQFYDEWDPKPFQQS